MTIDKSQCGSTCGVTAPLGIAGKTISSVTTFRHGSVEVVDILCTDALHYFVKSSCGRLEVGGTCEWGTGTKVGGR
jgi:hypothetical protein